MIIFYVAIFAILILFCIGMVIGRILADKSANAGNAECRKSIEREALRAAWQERMDRRAKRIEQSEWRC